MSKLDYQPASFFRRLGAYVYDALIAAGVFFCAAAISNGVGALALHFGWITLGDAPDLGGYLANNPLHIIWLICAFCGFYLWFWTHGGQTLGMRAWRVQIIDKEGGPVTFTKACVRLITATLGFSNLVAPFDPNKQGLQDIMAGTQLVLTKKREKPQKKSRK